MVARKYGVLSAGQACVSRSTCLRHDRYRWVRRPLRSRVRWAVVVLALVGAALVDAPTTNAASCPVNSDPYTAPAAIREACGTVSMPLLSTTALPFGGVQYAYDSPGGGRILISEPPASFDAAHASQAELEEFGIPTAPPEDSSAYPKWLAMIERNPKFVPAPSVLYGVPDKPGPKSSSTEPQAPLSEQANNQLATPLAASAGTEEETWSGYMNWGGTAFGHATAYYDEPELSKEQCSGAGSFVWAGIGGWFNTHLAQDGTAQGQTGIADHQAWWEILPEPEEKEKGVKAVLSLKATPGQPFEADVQYKGSGEYSFYMHNAYTNESAHVTETGKPTADEKTAEYIVERAEGDTLTNFGNLDMQGYTDNAALQTFKMQAIPLYNNKGERLAAPGAVRYKAEFTDKYYSCHAGEGEKTKRKGGTEGVAPTVSDSAATGVSATGATLHGNVNPHGKATGYHFEYGTETENYEASTPEASAGEGEAGVAVEQSITGLNPGTTYHFRIAANSSGGAAAGEDRTFKTSGTPPPPPPTVTTESARGIAAHTATLGATVNPNGLDTHYYFEYGTVSTSYGNDAPAPPGNDAGSGTTPVKVNVGLSGLAPYTTYYYRVVASNSTGTNYGAQGEFTTTATGTFSAGAYHTCALLSGGSIVCWGEDHYGQLGNGTNKGDFTTPVTVGGVTTATEVAAGGQHTCALLTSASIDCWGYNKFGELGNGTKTERTTPVAVSGISTAIQVSAGYGHTCAVLSGGKIDCWGENAYEQLGDGKTENSSIPVAVSGISTATSVTAGGFGTCAVLTGGKVDCWGYGEFGELGNGKTENSSTPVAVSGITNAVAVTAVGYFQACALLSTGSIDCWGDNESGELGNGKTENSSTPVVVSGITTGAAVTAGAFHTCALLSTKSLDCWGENYFGELGNGTTTNSSIPVAVSRITTGAGVIAGTYHTCGRLVGGAIECWGENAFGQLGNGTTTNSSTPVAVSGLP